MALPPFVTGAAYATVTLAFPCVTDDAVGAVVTVVPLASALAVPAPALLLALTCTVAYVVSSVRPEMRNEVAVSNEAATHADELSSRYSYPVMVAAPVGAVNDTVTLLESPATAVTPTPEGAPGCVVPEVLPLAVPDPAGFTARTFTEYTVF